MPLTPKLGIPYPVLADPADVPADTGELATRIDDLFNVPSGFAPLDATGKVPLANLPPISSASRVRIPVRLRVPRTATLAGNAGFSVTALTAWDMAAWEFYDAAEGRIYGHVHLPPALKSPPGAVLALHLAASVAGNAVVQAKVHPVANGGSLNPAAFGQTYGGGALTLAAGYALLRATYPITPVAALDTLLIEITRFGAHASDTLAGTLCLLDAYLEVDTA